MKINTICLRKRFQALILYKLKEFSLFYKLKLLIYNSLKIPLELLDSQKQISKSLTFRWEITTFPGNRLKFYLLCLNETLSNLATSDRKLKIPQVSNSSSIARNENLEVNLDLESNRKIF